LTAYLTLDEVDVDGRNVLVRSDLNVPLDDGAVADDFRIQAALPTLERLAVAGARVTVCSHLGRPRGPDPALSLQPVAERMDQLSRFDVGFLSGGQITLLENTRFHPGETANSPEFAASLAEGVDLFVQDAFGSVHRAHASTVGVAELVRSAAGPLLDTELSALGRFLGRPDEPYLVVLGGAKISDKLGVVENLLPRVDSMLIGGGMCFTLLRAAGLEVGASMVEESMLDVVENLINGPHGGKIVLPTDVVVADRFDQDAASMTVGVDSMPAGWMGLDIGPDTAVRFGSMIRSAATVFWNGPMGVFEWDAFRSGTEAVASAMVESPAFTAVGGGDSAAALRQMGLDSGVDHLSTGGGAGLELLEGKALPGVEVLKRWV
jgi:phosphoglycerate kinase